MSELKTPLETPYLDREIEGLHHLLIFNYTDPKKKRLAEYQQIKDTLLEYELNKEGLARVCAENQELKQRLYRIEDAAQAILQNWFDGDGRTRVSDLMNDLKTAIE